MLCPLCYSIRFTAARKVFSYVREQLSSRASCHTVPSPRGHILGSSNYIKVAPWGPRADFLSASLELSSNVAPALEIRPKDRTDANKATKASDTVTPASFQEVGDLLKRYGMDTSEIQQSPGLFSIPASLLEDRLEVFKECGWEKYTADMLIFTSILLFKMNAKDVIGSQNDSVTRSVLRCLLDVLEVQEDRQQHLISSISESSAVGYMTLSDCRTLAIRQYLRQLFSDEEIKSVLKTTMRTSGPFLPVRSIKNMLKLLMDDFKVPSARLLKHASMLTKGDRHYFHILKQQPRLLGMDLRVISSTMPRILLQSAEYLAELEDLFQRYNISAFQVSRQLTVISLAFDTVVRRLEGLKANPDLWRFHDLPDFLALVVKYVGVQTRVNFLRNMKVKNFGFPLLTCGNQQFHIALARGTLKGPTSSVQPQHLTPVAEWLDMPLVTVKKQLKSHIRNVPYFANDTKEIVEVLECMTNHHITSAQLLNGLSIVLYPGHVVRKYAAEVLSDSHVSSRRSQENLLHYIIFRIEKESHFAGPAAWSTALEDSEEDDEGRLISIRQTLTENILENLASEGADDLQRPVGDEKKTEWFKDD